MGATISKWSDLLESEALGKLVGEAEISPEDPFWNGLFSVSVRRPSTKGEWSQFEQAVHPLVVCLAKNLRKSRNLSSLVDVLLARQNELPQAIESEKYLSLERFLRRKC